MSYLDCFTNTDAIIKHLDTFVRNDAKGPISINPQLNQKYAEFVLVSCVTAYELAIKEIFFQFANSKNVLFGEFIRNHFERLNGRIRTEDITKHLGNFGDTYKNQFKKTLQNTNSTNTNRKNTNPAGVYNKIS